MAPVETSRLILDSTVLIRHLRGHRETVALVREWEKKRELATTAVNAFEVHSGARRARNRREALLAARGLLASLTLLPLEERAAERAAELQERLEGKGESVEIKDLLIGAIALEAGCAVATHNRSHFERIPDLEVVELPSGKE